MTENIEKRTLLNASRTLEVRADQLNELVKMSELLLNKLNRNESAPRKSESEIQLKDIDGIDGLDLIGLFERSADRIEKYINNIGSNLDNALNIID